MQVVASSTGNPKGKLTSETWDFVRNVSAGIKYFVVNVQLVLISSQWLIYIFYPLPDVALFPRVLLTHIPLYRRDWTPCGLHRNSPVVNQVLLLTHWKLNFNTNHTHYLLSLFIHIFSVFLWFSENFLSECLLLSVFGLTYLNMILFMCSGSHVLFMVKKYCKLLSPVLCNNHNRINSVVLAVYCYI